jgi:mono/diheme cytochrome c family protein
VRDARSQEDDMRHRKALQNAVLVALVASFGAVVPALAEDEVPDASVPQIPEEAKQAQNPVPYSEAAVESGRLIYSSQCLMCHGDGGDGKGELVERFGYVTPDFTTAEFQRSRTDGAIYFVLTHGHGKMRGQGGRLNDTTRWNLVHYIRSLGPGE